MVHLDHVNKNSLVGLSSGITGFRKSVISLECPVCPFLAPNTTQSSHTENNNQNNFKQPRKGLIVPHNN